MVAFDCIVEQMENEVSSNQSSDDKATSAKIDELNALLNKVMQ